MVKNDSTSNLRGQWHREVSCTWGCFSPGDFSDFKGKAKRLIVNLTVDPMDCSSPGSSVHAIFQARIWSGLSFPSSGDLPDPGIEPTSLISSAYV